MKELSVLKMKTSIKEKVSSIKNTIVCVISGIAATALSVVTVFAKTYTPVTMTNNDVSIDTTMGTFIGMILTIMRWAGLAIAIWGAYMWFSSLKESNPEAQQKAIWVVVAGIGMLALKSVLSMLGIIA